MGKENNIHQEDGFILVVCLLIMVVLTILGIVATTTTMIELRISGNDKVAKSAFYKADSGIYTSPKAIRQTIVEGGNPPTTALRAIQLNDPAVNDPNDPATWNGITVDGTGDFYRKIFGFDLDAAGDTLPTSLYYALDGARLSPATALVDKVDVSILRSGTFPLPGGSVEFASGYEGAGHGTTGGVGVLFTVTSTGRAPDSALATIEAEYRYIPGTAGGL